MITPPIALITLTEKTVAPFTALCFSTRTTLSTMDQYGPLHRNVLETAAHLNAVVAGPTQWIYTGVTGDETRAFQLDIAVPVVQPVGQPTKFSYKTFDSFRCVTHRHVGPWEELRAVYDAVFAELYRAGYAYNQLVREVYTFVDLDNPARHVTEIQIGID